MSDAILPARVRQLFTQFSGIFRDAYSTAPTFADMIATAVPSTSSQNDYSWMAKLPALREWLGERVLNNVVAHSYELKNKTFEGTVGVSRDDVDDDNLGIYSSMIIPQLGRSAAKHPDQQFVTLLQGGHGLLCYDGQYFFDTDHPVNSESSATQLNYTSTGLALTQANWLVVRARMMAFKGEDEKSMGIVPNLLVVPPALEGTAREILESDRIYSVGGATYAAAPTNITKGMGTVLVVPELAGQDTTWYALDTSGIVKPFIKQTRRAVAFTSMQSLSDESVWRLNRYEFGVDYRGNAGFGLWFQAYKAVA